MKKSRLQQLYEKVVEHQSLFTMQMCLTENCNQDCVHCLIGKKRNLKMTSETAKNILLQGKKLGCMNVSFTGGEVFGERDFKDVLIYANSLGFRIMIYTNGTLIDAKTAEFLKSLKFLDMQLSLFAAEPHCHDKITRRKGSFDALYRAAKMLRKNRVSFYFVMSVMRQNFSQLKGVIYMSKKEKWKVFYNFLIFSSQSVRKKLSKLRITDNQMEEAYDLGVLPYCNRYGKLTYFGQDFFQPRSLGKYHLYVDVTGKVFPSVKLQINVGDLKRDSLSEIWHNSKELNRLRNLNVQDFECFDCEYKTKCPWSLSFAFLEYGDIFKKPQELCRFTRFIGEKAYL